MSITEEQLRAEHSEKAVELRRQVSELKNVLQGYRREHGKLEVFFEEVREAITPVVEYQPVTQKEAVRSGVLIEPVFHITDTHKGAVQEPNEIEGFNAFNPDIATERSIAFAEKAVKWANFQKQAYRIEEASVIITGDLISGDIHDELRITNAYPTPVQVVETAKDIAQQIQIFAPHFKKVKVHFITEDNHSRLTKKPQAKEAGQNSLNYLVGSMLQAYIASLSNVEMNIYPMLEKVVEVNGRLYLISHGHNVRGWMGVPWYGIERKVGKEAQARLQIIMQEAERAREIGFHKYILGHFHTAFFGRLYFLGASLSGTDAYDHQAGRYDNPGQNAWLTHPKHGEFNMITFVL
jgi:hypothetical protein